METVNGDKNAGSSSHKKVSYAPWYNVSKQPIVSVEHPFIIKDVDKGLATLGSPSKLEEVRCLNVKRHQYLTCLAGPRRWRYRQSIP